MSGGTLIFMKKLIFALAIVVAIAFAGCSDDKEQTQDLAKDIVGTWKFYAEFDPEDGGWWYADSDPGYFDIYTFRADGTGIWDLKEGPYHYTINFTYNIIGDMLFTHNENGMDEISDRFTVTKDELTLYFGLNGGKSIYKRMQ